MRNPVLKTVDLSKSSESDHPDIVTDGRTYLVNIGGRVYVGSFSRQWYGLNFEGGPWQSGLQFDAPGYNRSDWSGVWEIVDED